MNVIILLVSEHVFVCNNSNNKCVQIYTLIVLFVLIFCSTGKASSDSHNKYTVTSSGEAVQLFLSWRQLVNGNLQIVT